MNRSTAIREIAPPTDAAGAAEPINYGPLPEIVGYRLKRAHAYSVQTWMDMFEDLGLAWGQYSVLLLIGLNPGISQLALAEAAGLDGSTIVPIANRFVKLRWIRRVRRAHDRRLYSLRVTPQGQSVLDRAQALLEEHDGDLCAPLTSRERATLLHLLSKITDREDPGSSAPFSRATGG